MKHSIKWIPGINLLIGLLVINAYSAGAQTKHISLEEAISMSIKNSNQLKLSMAKADEADAEYRQATNNYLPDLKASGSYLRINNPDITLKIKTSSSSNSGSGSSGETSGVPKVSEASYGMASLSLPLFSGFKIRNGQEAAKDQKLAAITDLANDKESIIENTIIAYNNLYKAIKTVEVILESLKEEDRRVIDFSNLEQNGLMARNDLLKAQLQQSNVELTLLDAQNKLHIATVNMNLLMGMPENTEIQPDSLSTAITYETGSLDQWEHTALNNRKDMQALQFRIKGAGEMVKVAKGDYYPGLALTGGYVALNIPGLMTVTNAINVGIGFQYNIGSLWKSKAKVDEAKARVRELQANEGILYDHMRTEINQNYENYLLSRKKITVYEVAVKQAEENYRIVKDKYNNTLATTTELLEADVAQLQAKINYIFSQGDAIVAFKQLEQAAGILSNDIKQ